MRKDDLGARARAEWAARRRLLEPTEAEQKRLRADVRRPPSRRAHSARRRAQRARRARRAARLPLPVLHQTREFAG